MELIQVQETSQLLVPEWHTMEADPAPPAAQTSWRTPGFTALQAGPFDLHAGDILDVRLQHQFDAEMPGAGYWTVSGQQSEHWALWIMASTAVKITGGVTIVPQMTTNWDWYIHHLPISRVAYWKVTADMPTAYVYDYIYFKSGISYTFPEPQHRKVQINSGAFPKLQVGVFR